MRTWILGILCELKFLGGDRLEERKTYRIHYYEGTETGTEEARIEVEVGQDGTVSLNDLDGSGSIYLYPEQAKKLYQILHIHNTLGEDDHDIQDTEIEKALKQLDKPAGRKKSKG